MNDLAERLTMAEADLLDMAEAVIERGIKTFLEVGEALASVRDNRLYRAEFGTFEEYAEQRWGFSRAYADRLVAASAVATILTPIGAEIKNEAQARELAPLINDPEKLRAAFEKVAAQTDGKPTAAALRAAVDEVLSPESEVAQIAHAELDRAEVRQAAAPDPVAAGLLGEGIAPSRLAEIEEVARPAVQFGRLLSACQFFVESMSDVDLTYAKRGFNPAKADPIRQALDHLNLVRRALEAAL